MIGHLTLDQEIISRSSVPSRTMGTTIARYLGGRTSRTLATLESKTC